MKDAYLLPLINAHINGDDTSFRLYAQQAISHIKNERTKAAHLAALDRTASKFVTLAPPKESGHLEALSHSNIDTMILPGSSESELLPILRELRHREAILANGLRPKDRLLFSGPSGEGKTMAAMWLASKLGVPAYGLNIPSVVESYLGKTGANLDMSLRACPKRAVLVLDEFDALASVRTTVKSGADAERNLIVNTLLSTLDRAMTPIIVATTNRADIIDPAILRRFGKPIRFESSAEERARLAGALRSRYSCGLVDVSACQCFADVAAMVERVAVDEIITREEAENAKG